ncbi:MAG: EscN/YscN/HrcN family type III secretion system ATPase, partial [Pseudomonadota bacterium]
MTGAADLLRDRLKTGMAFRPAGRVADAFGATVRTDLPGAAIGEICRIEAPDGGPRIDAEVIGFRSGHTVLAPLGDLHGLSLGASVTATGRARSVPVGDGLLGRVVDAMAQPMDGRGAIAGPTAPVPLRQAPPDPMSRAVIRTPFPVGIRAVDGLLTCGLGQRVGIFGEPGGGKSTLLASLVKGCEADVCVVALIGERG